MAVQNTFATKTGTIPLSELDENFATPIIIGSTPIALGSTITSIEGLTLAAPTLVTPLLGTPASGTLTNCTFPTLNQSTTGNAANVTGVVAVENGGTGTTTPSLVPGTNVTITGTWPNQTIDSSGGGSGMTYPSAGIAKSTGSAWETSYSTTGTGTALVLSTSPTLVTPALGTPTSGTLTNCTLPQLSASTGSALVSTIQSGTGTVIRTVASKLNDTVSIKDFGAVGDGAADDTAAIQAAINYTGSKLGGTILLPAGSYKITSTLSCLYPNILFVGDGSDEPHNIGTQGAAAATKLVWAGASGGTMLNIASVDGVNNVKYSGGGVRSIFFNSGCTTNGTGASYGIDLVSFNEGVFENVMFREFETCGIRVGCITQLWDARDPQHNRFINCWSRNFVNQSGGLFLLEGDTGMYSGTGSGGTYTLANVSLNHFENCGAQFYNGIAFNIKNSDHNFFINCRANRIATGTGQGIVLQGSNQRNTGALLGTLTSDLAFVARKNVFFGFSGGNQIVAKGKTITATVTMTIATPAVVTWTAHGLAANTAVTFSTTGTLPTGLTAGTLYYVLAPTTNTFTVSATVGGAAIPTSGTQSGVHSCTTPSYLYPSYKNIFTMMDDSNNTPFPTIETDALCYVTMRTDGVGYYPNQVSGVFSYAATIDNASDMALQARSRVGNESLRLENRNNNGLRIARPATDNLTIDGEWALAVIGAAGSAGENLKVSRIAGTGCLEVSSIAQNSVTITATTTLTNTNAIVLVDATSGNRVITLPLAASYGISVSPAIKIRRIDSTSANTVTVQRQSTNNLNGGTTETLTTGTGKTYICNGTADWYSL